MTFKRLAWLGAAALAVAALLWVASRTYWEDVSEPMPLRGEAARDPFYAAQRFAQLLGAQTERYRALTVPVADGVLVLAGWSWNLTARRREQFETWVADGGRLVLDRSFIGDPEFESWSGIGRVDEKSENARRRESPDSALASAEDGCRDLEWTGTRAYLLCDFDDGSFLTSSRRTTWTLRDDSGIQALRVNIGRGSVTVVNATPFLYRSFLDGDHADLFAAATEIRRGARIYFLADEDNPSLLELAWTYGAPVVALFLALVALWLWRSGLRFGPLAAPPERARRSLAEQIRGTGQFAMRFGGGESLHSAVVRALSEAAARRIACYDQLSDTERVALIARETGRDLRSLEAAMTYRSRQRSWHLGSAIALLESARRQVLLDTKRSMNGS